MGQLFVGFSHEAVHEDPFPIKQSFEVEPIVNPHLLISSFRCHVGFKFAGHELNAVIDFVASLDRQAHRVISHLLL